MSCVGGDGSTSGATSLGGELASLQRLTQPGEGEEEEEEEEEEHEKCGEETLSRDEEDVAAVAAVTMAEPAEPAEPAAKQPRAVISTIVSDEDNNAPIDWILSRRLPENSRRFYRKALEAGKVKVDGRKVRRFVRVKRGARISVDLGQQQQQQQQGEPQPSANRVGAVGANTVGVSPTSLVFPERLPRLRIVFEDEHLFAIM